EGKKNGKRSEGVASLGRRITERARELDAAAHAGIFLSPGGKGGNGTRFSPIKRNGENGGKEAFCGRGRTLVHGDLKTWNAFFEREGGVKGGGGVATTAGERVKFIDWQWCGEGLAAADVAYIICTSLEPSVLASEGELLAHYHAELSAGLEKRFSDPKANPATNGGGGGGGGASWYPFEQFMDDYRVSFLDYMRCEA
ncbi:unnamed protein product, partial [Laminaria digitata]